MGAKSLKGIPQETNNNKTLVSNDLWYTKEKVYHIQYSNICILEIYSAFSEKRKDLTWFNLITDNYYYGHFHRLRKNESDQSHIFISTFFITHYFLQKAVIVHRSTRF